MTYNKRNYAADVNSVKKSTLIKTDSSMIIKPIMIGSYYKNNKKIRRLDYWIDVINRRDTEALVQLKQA